MDLDAVGARLLDEALQVLVQVGDDLGSHGVGALAALLGIGEGCQGGQAPLYAAHGVAVQGGLQGRFGDRDADLFPEIVHLVCSEIQ